MYQYLIVKKQLPNLYVILRNSNKIKIDNFLAFRLPLNKYEPLLHCLCNDNDLIFLLIFFFIFKFNRNNLSYIRIGIIRTSLSDMKRFFQKPS